MATAPHIDALSFLDGKSKMDARIRTQNWAGSSLGTPADWPHALKVALGICLGAAEPMAIMWGTAPHILYNDAWAELMGDMHPLAIGRPANEVWPLQWHHVAGAFSQVLKECESLLALEDKLSHLHDGTISSRYSFSGTAIRGEDGRIAGVLKQAREIAANAVKMAADTRFILALSDGLLAATTLEEAATTTAARLCDYLNLAFAAVVTPLPGAEHDRTRVLAITGVAAGTLPADATFPTPHRSPHTLYLPDLRETPDVAPSIVPQGIGAFASVTCSAAGAPPVLYAGRTAVQKWTEPEQALLTTAADRLGVTFGRLAGEDAAGAQRRALEALNRLGADLTAVSHDLDGLLHLFIETATRLTGAAYGAFFDKTPGETEDVWRLGALVGAPREAFTRFGMPRQTALFAPTFAGEGAVRSGDVSKDARFGSMGGMPDGHLPVRSYLALPVISLNGERLGALLLGSPLPNLFGDREENMVAAFAGMTSVAIDNARLYRASLHEVAERARAEEALRELNETLEQRIEERTLALAETEEQLRQSQKMEAVGQLTGGLAHDFNNLLTGITGNLEVLDTRVRQGRLSELIRHIASAQEAARRAAALTHRLLAFSRRQTLNPKPVDLNVLIREMQDLIGRTAGPTVALEVASTPGLWHVLVDPNQMENALLNLCLNARDAMPDGGRLMVETCNRFLDASTGRERDLPPGQYVALSVSDNGTGMTPDVVRRAFDPFFTTKPIGRGTGLGLSMIYGFVRQSDGHARIYSEPGTGTSVTMYLPRHLHEAADATAAAPAAEDAVCLHEPEGDVILVVDDEPSVRMLIQELLEENGYTVLEAGDSAAGLKILQSNARIDLLISDVGLPGGMNGRQMADAARETRPDLKVLFITGYAENAVLSHGHLSPWMHVMTKPFTMDALASRVSDLLQR